VADLWRRLLDEVAAGRGVQVALSPGMEIAHAKRRRGRPRVRGAGPFAHYVGYLAHQATRPRCLACGKRLRRDEGPLGCSPAHVEKVIADAQAVIALAEKFGLLGHANRS
jgi:hypothetical protein